MARNTIEEQSGKRHRRHRYAPAGSADYRSLDAGRLLKDIEAITRNGGAVRLGKTRDGGAFAIGVYGDGPEPYTDYLRPDDDVNAYIESLANDMSQLPTS